MVAAIMLLVLPAASAQPQQRPPLDALKSRIENITRSINARWGVYIRCIESGEEIAINADEQMDTMSTIKIPLMVEAYRQAEEGKFKLSDMHALKEAEKQPGTGVLQRWAEGTLMSLKDLVDLMIIVSDNTATDILFRRVGGPAAVNKLMDTYGYDRIRATGLAEDWFKALRARNDAAAFHREGKNPYGLATPRQMGLLLEKLEKGEAVSKEASEQMLRHLRGQLYATRIPRNLAFTPYGTRPPHKTGDFLPYIGNDVGVLELAGKRVVVSIFTAGHFGLGTILEEAIGRITEQAGSYFGSRPDGR
jgi:beta-lactamase class A